jgi:hypothetical protein
VPQHEKETSQRCARAEFGSLNVAFGREREVVGDALESENRKGLDAVQGP